MIRNNKCGQSGFSLLELAVLLVIIGMLLLVAVLAVPVLTERGRLDTTQVTMDDVAEALVSFAAIHSRLPCPDINLDGLEGTAGVCAAADVVGRVPYRDLGFPDPVLDEAHLPVRYAVYRNSAATADLAAKPVPNRFIPVLPGDPPTLTLYTGLPDNPEIVTVVPPEVPLPYITPLGINPVRVTTTATNDLDFCLALRTAKAAADSASYVHTLDLGGATPAFNAAFVLASGGVEDADGDTSDMAFDGVNEGAAGVDFESPARRRSDSAAGPYDDVVYAMPFGLLESKMSCSAITIGVTSSANVAIAAAHALVQGEDAEWSAELAVNQAELAVASSAFSVVMGAITIWVAANDVALATAGCVAALPDICAAEVPGGIALGLAIAAEVAAVATVVLAAIALVEANEALDAAEATIPGLYDHTEKTLQDAIDADARGGQM
ncbi:MAG: type II secretion system GspH family protein [Gammaproteobacteria bacterium]|nr:type II secretion system GspH family protein [Gammaproteobacteria bacterium]